MDAVSSSLSQPVQISLWLSREVAMEVLSGRSLSSSTLNPNAPLFVPLAYRTVEDFSDQWWALVQSSPWFRDYWLEECFQDPETDLHFNDNDDPVLPDVDAFCHFDDCSEGETKAEKEEHRKELVSIGALKWRKARDPAVLPRNFEKAPKIVSVKVSPRPIQQPR